MSEKNTPVYLVAVHNVTDPELLRQYLDGVFAIGGLDVLALDSTATTLEGDTRGRAVIVRFPNRKAAVGFYDAEEYQKVLPLRLKATSDNWLGMVKGLDTGYRDKIEHLYQGAFVKGDLTAVDDVVHPDYVYHGFAPIGPGPEGMKTYIRDGLAGASDIEVEIADFFAEGDRAAARLSIAASHTGVLFGAPATGKRLELMVHCTYRFKDGKLIEEWDTTEEGKMMTALGLLPEPPG